MVTRRLAPLVVAAAIAFAPVALDACQVMCAWHTAAALAPAHAAHQHQASAPSDRTGPTAHSCHHLAVAPLVNGKTDVRAVPHRCTHVDDLPAAATTVLHANLTAPGIQPIAVFDPAPARHIVRGTGGTSHTPPPRTAAIAQLRV